VCRARNCGSFIRSGRGVCSTVISLTSILLILLSGRIRLSGGSGHLDVELGIFGA
jgi:hypothetical protein